MANGTSKPLMLVKGHRTKAEKKIRAEAEASILTGHVLVERPEVMASKSAHAEFMRINELLTEINKNDDLYGDAINTHCELIGECDEYKQLKKQLEKDLAQVIAEYKDAKIEYIEYSEIKGKIIQNIFTCDKKIMEKRKMKNDIAKENILTIQSSMRAIPKKPKKEEPSKEERRFGNV